jgi:AraC-like DNA-binding protein
MTMKPLNAAAHQKTEPRRWFSERLPVGLSISYLKESAESVDISLPPFDKEGLALTFVNYKGDLQVAVGGSSELQPLSPGLGLLSAANKALTFKSFSPVQCSLVVIYIGRDWINLFMRDNSNFSKIEQVFEKEENIITCRLGRRQLSIFSSMVGLNKENRVNLLEIQNGALSLLEYFLCNRHRSLLGADTTAGINNEDDLSLIKEVESYISEYYCSDTFTVDSILKKTYTSYHKLNFLFKSIHGMTISEYIRNKRIEKSKEMIADNVKSISQIAYEIGYSSISNYILAFKKIYQITPGKYKKQMEA